MRFQNILPYFKEREGEGGGEEREKRVHLLRVRLTIIFIGQFSMKKVRK